VKLAIVIPDGCADEPQESLGGRTPLQAAHLPHMDALARAGVVGRADNVPPSLTPASDVATLSLLGYDPLVYYTGRSPLEAAAMGITLGPDDYALRCNLVTIEAGCMRSFTADHISTAEAAELIAALREAFGGRPTPFPLELYAGVQYRHALIARSCPGLEGLSRTRTQPPHDIPDRPIAEYLPQGPLGAALVELMEASKSVLADHPVNHARRAAGKRPATQIWLWGQGKRPALPPFQELYGKTGAMISAVDLVRGVGLLLGWKRIDVPGATGYLDTDYAAKGRYAVAALAEQDVVCVHVEAPDEASHEGRTDEKILALERIDAHIVGPLFQALQKYDCWRMLVSPDHRTTLRTRAHAYGPVPFVLAGTGITSLGQSSYDEVVAAASPLSFERGCELMGYVLGLQ
jgi:2,3-bisphosphoglycerate-independent phosphoglycerate mutase